MTRHIPLLFGSQLGRLTVLARTFGDDRGVKYHFKCACGNMFVAHAVDVRRGKRKSCGCRFKKEKRNVGDTIPRYR